MATMNVMSFAIMMTGGALWAFDISNMDDLRGRMKRKKAEEDVTGESDKVAEGEWAEFVGRGRRTEDEGGEKGT